MELDVKELCCKLAPVYGKKKIGALWHSYLIENMDGKREIEATLQVLAAKLDGSFDSNKVLLSPPTREEAAGEYPIGTVWYNGRGLYPFGLREDEWIQHCAIFGRSGAGKTNLVFELIGSLLEAKKPFLIFDWKRNYRDCLAKYKDADILVFTVGRSISPIQFNPLIPPEGTDPKTWLKKLIEIIADTYYLGEGVRFLLQKSIDRIYREAGVYKGNPEQWPTMRDVLDYLQDYKATGRESGWLISTLRAIYVLCFGEMGKVINTPQQVGLDKLLEKNVILELDSLTNTDKTFFIESLLLWIHHQRLSQARREKFSHAIIIEEAHHILLKQQNATESIIDIVLREIREFGTSIILVDQHPSLISLPALGNTYTTVTMNLKSTQDTRMAASYSLLDKEKAKYFGRLEVGMGIVKLQGRCFNPFLIKIPLVRVPKGTVTDEMLRAKTGADSAYSTPASTSGSEPGAGGEIPAGGKRELNGEEKAFLVDIAKYPVSGVAKRYERIKISSRRGNKIKEALLGRNLIEEESIVIKAGRTVLLRLSKKGTEIARKLGIKTNVCGRPASLEHEYWKERVADYMSKKGFQVEQEKKIGNGKAIDIEVRYKNQVFAVEIETGKSDAVENIRKDLDAGMEYVLTVTTNVEAEDKIKKKLQEKELTDPERVRVVSIPSLGF